MNLLPKKTLAGKISLAITVPFVLIIAGMGFLSTIQIQSQLEKMSSQQRSNTLHSAVRLINDHVDASVKNYLRSVAESNRNLLELYYRRVLAGQLSRAQALREYSRIMLDPDYGRIGTTGYLAGVDTSGVLVIHPKSQGVNASGHAFMQEAMKMKNGYLEYEWKNVGEEVARIKAGYLSYFEPWDIMVWASSYKAEFSSLVDIESLASTVEEIKVGEQGFVMLIDQDGRVYAGGHKLTVLLPAGDKKQAVLNKLIAAANEAEIQGNAEKLMGAIEYDSGEGAVLASWVRVPDTNWIVVTNEFTNEYKAVVRTIRLMVFLAILIASIAIVFTVRFLMRRFLAPMQGIQQVSQRVSDGDLSSHITDISDDEIGEMASFFNTVIEAFAMLVRDIRQATQVLLEATHTLGASAQEISSTANQQAAAVKEILSTMEDSDTLSKNVAVKIQEVVKIAYTTQESVEKGFTYIQDSLDKMNEIRETNGNTIGGIKTLGSQIDSIWEIVNIINGIADQTKIIAFNAELEAASAGEAGKNFQIVAGEIRRLADNTVDSTNEIKKKINEIQHASDKLIIASEEGTQRIREGWDISQSIRGIFEDVLSSSEISAASAADIAHSIKMQVSSFEQIFLTLKQISEGINNFVDSTRTTSESSDGLKDIADRFKSSIDRYSLGEEAGRSGSADSGSAGSGAAHG
ncbi:MAG: methyl-accepting chemotaxis protein [Spirochaetaceae bacterium]|nr:MAG: methyl-accepting chemotaxis protein [Spirochaetaceae bacterium]